MENRIPHTASESAAVLGLRAEIPEWLKWARRVQAQLDARDQAEMQEVARIHRLIGLSLQQPQLTVIAGTARRRTARRGQLRLVAKVRHAVAHFGGDR